MVLLLLLRLLLLWYIDFAVGIVFVVLSLALFVVTVVEIIDIIFNGIVRCFVFCL